MKLIKEISTKIQQLGLHGMDVELIQDNNSQQLLLKLLNQQLEYRKSRSLNYRLKLAKFPQVKLLADTETAKLVEQIDISLVIDNHENLFFIGGTGSGKTHLAIALGYTALERGKRVRFYTLVDLCRKLLLAKTYNTEQQFLLSLQRFDVLIIDELGYTTIDKGATSLLFELIAKLYEQRSIFITTHLKFDEWGEMFGDLKATKVAIDRLTHHCKIIETGNISFRTPKVSI
jgi:DNA replication protein DnaC